MQETIERIVPALPGEAQNQNAAVAMATLSIIADSGWDLPIEARRTGIATGRLPARMERFKGDPLVVIDGAHNDASAVALADALDTLCGQTPRERRVLVVGISNDKDSSAILKPLARRFGCLVATRFLDNPRATSPEELAAVAQSIDGTGTVLTAATPAEAFAVAQDRAGTGGAVVFAGSLLFAAEARRAVLAERETPPG